MHGFQNNFAQVLSLKSRIAIWIICSCTYTNPPPSPPKKCQISIPCQFIEKYPLPPKKNGFFIKENHLPLHPPHSPRPHTPPPPSPTMPNFFLIWIIRQLDSVLVNFFYKLTNNPNLFPLRIMGAVVTENKSFKWTKCPGWRNFFRVDVNFQTAIVT